MLVCVLPVEGHHAARDGHVHRHLGRHAAKQEHLLPGVGMEGRVIQVLGIPYLLSSDTWWLKA